MNAIMHPAYRSRYYNTLILVRLMLTVQGKDIITGRLTWNSMYVKKRAEEKTEWMLFLCTLKSLSLCTKQPSFTWSAHCNLSKRMLQKPFEADLMLHNQCSIHPISDFGDWKETLRRLSSVLNATRLLLRYACLFQSKGVCVYTCDTIIWY